MIKQTLAIIFTITVMSFNINGKEIGGIKMPNTLKSGDVELNLNGAGVRTKYFLDLYVGGLYTINKSSDAKNIIDADEKMGIRLHIVSSLITSEKMEDATREGFENYGSKSDISKEIETFINVFKEKINTDDIFELIYSPTTGVEVYKNNKLATTITGVEFKKALFGIWLGNNPAQASLKSEMLGLE